MKKQFILFNGKIKFFFFQTQSLYSCILFLYEIFHEVYRLTRLFELTLPKQLFYLLKSFFFLHIPFLLIAVVVLTVIFNFCATPDIVLSLYIPIAFIVWIPVTESSKNRQFFKLCSSICKKSLNTYTKSLLIDIVDFPIYLHSPLHFYID